MTWTVRRRPSGPAFEDPREQDAELEQHEQRRHRDQHRHRVWCRRRHRRDDGDPEDHVAAVARQLLGGDDPQPRDREHADRDLEHQPDQGHQDHRELVVVGGPDEDVEVVVVEVLQEVDGSGQRQEVRERDARDEQGGHQQHQR
jgi:hypothetical protein